MNIKTWTAAFVICGFSMTSMMVEAATADRKMIQRDQQVDRDRDLDRDRLRDRDRLDEPDRDRDRIQDRTHVPDYAKLKDDDIYGSELMTRRERNEYRQALQNADNAEARERIRTQHQHEMKNRAQEQGVALKPASEGPIYGGAMLTVQERNEYRERLREMDSEDERGKFLAQHRERMQERAKAQGVPIEDIEES